jgi:hypothetical protein
MLEDPDKNEPPFDPSEFDRAYRNYVENCRRLCSAPMSWEQAQALIVEWSDACFVGRSVPSKDHRRGTTSNTE